MSDQTPRMIRREDIRKGDRIRRSVVSEYTASRDQTEASTSESYTYELIERPVPLPAEEGVYADKDGDLWLLTGSGMYYVASGGASGGAAITRDENAATYAPFTRLRREAEVVAEVLNAVDADLLIYPMRTVPGALAAIAAKYGVTL